MGTGAHTMCATRSRDCQETSKIEATLRDHVPLPGFNGLKGRKAAKRLPQQRKSYEGKTPREARRSRAKREQPCRKAATRSET
jgi:hypothetical protein